jgi:hypothetical protein
LSIVGQNRPYPGFAFFLLIFNANVAPQLEDFFNLAVSSNCKYRLWKQQNRHSVTGEGLRPLILKRHGRAPFKREQRIFEMP